MLLKLTNLKGNVLEISASSNQQMTFLHGEWSDGVWREFGDGLGGPQLRYMCMCKKVL